MTPPSSENSDASAKSRIPERAGLEGLETTWARAWEAEGTYSFDRTKSRSEVYAIDTPPPTVSGELHLGHISSYTHADTIARFQRMAGKEVFRHAVGMVTDVMTDAFAATGYTAADLDWFVPHQANLRIIEAVSKRVGIELERFVLNIERYGNTSAASIPLALDEAVRSGQVKPGQTLMLEGVGGGFTWGAVLLKL